MLRITEKELNKTKVDETINVCQFANTIRLLREGALFNVEGNLKFNFVN